MSQTTSQSKHKRWVEEGESPFFPKDKYQFSQHLRIVGDTVYTPPLSKKDAKRFIDAAYEWSWHKRWRVRCIRDRVTYDSWEVSCTLVAKHRHREYS